MFESQVDRLNYDRVEKFFLKEDNLPISNRKVLDLWKDSESFRSFFITLLSKISFTAYHWETPPLTMNNLGEVFEFVIINSPSLSKTPNSSAFSNYLNPENQSIAAFSNLGGDALLIVPSRQSSTSAYGHLAAFVREAPEYQKHLLWQRVGQEMQQRVSVEPIWLNTAGAGVPWLHIRLDSRPKYYKHKPYQQFNYSG